MLEMTATAAALLRPPSGKAAASLLTAITLPHALWLAAHDAGSAPPRTVRLHVDQLDGTATLVSLGGSGLPAQHAASPGDSTHLTATACRMRQARPARPAARARVAGLVVENLVAMQLIGKASAAPAPVNWAAISTSLREPGIAVSADCCLHLGAVSQPRSAARRPRVPAGAASHLGSQAQPGYADAYAAAGERGPQDAAQTVTDHWLVGQATHGGASTQGLVSKPMNSSASVAPGASALQDTSGIQADSQPQMVYEVIHCVTAPRTAEARKPAQAAGFALPRRSQHGQRLHDRPLRGMAASLATAQQAYTSASQVVLRTGGAMQHDGSHGPSGPASTCQAAHGAAAWSLARCLEAEAFGELQCSGFDSASVSVQSTALPGMLLGDRGCSGLVRGDMDMRTSAAAGECRAVFDRCHRPPQ